MFCCKLFFLNFKIFLIYAYFHEVISYTLMSLLYKNRSAEHIKTWANLGSFQIIIKVANKIIVGIKNISQLLVINQYYKNITIIWKYEVLLLFMLLDFKLIPKYSKTNAFVQVKIQRAIKLLICLTAINGDSRLKNII